MFITNQPLVTVVQPVLGLLTLVHCSLVDEFAKSAAFPQYLVSGHRELSKRTKMRHCKPHQNIQSAYWAHASGEEVWITHLLLTFVFIYLFPSLQFAGSCYKQCKLQSPWMQSGAFVQTVSTHLLASELDHALTINNPLWSSFGSTTKATSSKLVLVVWSVPECESAKLTSIQMNPTSLSISLYVVLKSIISSFSPTTPWSFLKTGLIAFG